MFKAAIKRAKNDACISSSEREQARNKVSMFKAAIKQAKNDACVSSSEREQVRNKVQWSMVNVQCSMNKRQ
jgi:uncharacterized membrane protein YebE (DUF533 family)